MSDIISEGNIGLMTAAEYFDAERGHSFGNYAVWWIRSAIEKYVIQREKRHLLPSLDERIENGESNRGYHKIHPDQKLVEPINSDGLRMINLIASQIGQVCERRRKPARDAEIMFSLLGIASETNKEEDPKKVIVPIITPERIELEPINVVDIAEKYKMGSANVRKIAREVVDDLIMIASKDPLFAQEVERYGYDPCIRKRKMPPR